MTPLPCRYRISRESPGIFIFVDGWLLAFNANSDLDTSAIVADRHTGELRELFLTDVLYSPWHDEEEKPR